jgi:transcription initiation factor IIE alpha subunit
MSRPPSPREAAHLGTVYECPDCETRYLDERRCPDCNLFCRRIDTGGNCPHCDEPVAISDLTRAAMPLN